MRALALILVSAQLGLWTWFAFAVAPEDAARPVRVPDDGRDEPSAASLNNEGVALDRAGRRGDALAHFERAHDFRPLDATIRTNLERQRARVRERAWLRALVPLAVLVAFFAVAMFVLAAVRRARDARRLRRVRLRGDPWVRIDRDADAAELRLAFSEDVDRLVRRHPLTIVWSSARQGKHMKSRPPVVAEGRSVKVQLDAERVERLRRYPGDWKGFLYLGKTPVGETAARVG